MHFRPAPSESKTEANVQSFLKSLTIESIENCTNVEFLANVLIEKLKEITAPTFAELSFQKKQSQSPYRAPEIDAMVADIDQRIQSATSKFNNTIDALNEIKKNNFATSEQIEIFNLYKKEFSGRTAFLFDHILSLVPEKKVLSAGLGRG